MSRHLVVYTDTPGANGAERVCHSIALALCERGYKLSYVQHEARHRLIDEREAEGIDHIFLFPDNLYSPDLSARSLRDVEEPLEVLRRLRPDGILFSDGAPMSSLMAKRAARELRIPYVVTTHCVSEDWCEQYADFLPEIAAGYRAAAQVVCVSIDNLRALRRCFGLGSDRGRVIINGRPEEFFAEPDPVVRKRLRKELGLTKSTMMTLTVGQLFHYKGHLLQLMALAKVRREALWPNVCAVWAGTGMLKPSLERLACKLRVESNLRLLGYRNDVAGLLDASDVFVLTSRFEGMPLVVLEAMAKGLPVVATAVSGVPEAMGDTGKLLPNPRDGEHTTVDALAETLLHWANEPELRREIGAAARERAMSLFREKRTISEHLSVIEHALGPPD